MQKSQKNKQQLLVADHDHEKYVNLSVQWNRWILKPMGLWPGSINVSLIEKYLNRLINIICYSLIGYLLIPCTLYVFFEVENVYKEIKLFGPLVFCVAAFIKYHWLIIHGVDIRECVEHIKWDWKHITNKKDREIMAVNANFGKRLVTVCTFFMFTGFTFYFLVVPLSSERMIEENGNVTFIPMVFPFSRFIIDIRHSPINEIFFSIQIIAGVLIYGITVGACSLAAVFAMHACGQMEVLICWLDCLIDGRSDMCQSVDGRIAGIVNQHVRILKCVKCIFACMMEIGYMDIKVIEDIRIEFLELTEQALKQVSFAEFLACTLNLCLVGYYIITDLNSSNFTITVTYIILYTSLTFNIFIFCYIGEIVAEQCRRVGEMSYMIEWYRLPGNKKLCCILIMAMSNAAIKFTAGSMVELSINTFSNVVKTSVAYLNVLRTLA